MISTTPHQIPIEWFQILTPPTGPIKYAHQIIPKNLMVHHKAAHESETALHYVLLRRSLPNEKSSHHQYRRGVDSHAKRSRSGWLQMLEHFRKDSHPCNTCNSLRSANQKQQNVLKSRHVSQDLDALRSNKNSKKYSNYSPITHSQHGKSPNANLSAFSTFRNSPPHNPCARWASTTPFHTDAKNTAVFGLQP